jgi:hypothetical protein
MAPDSGATDRRRPASLYRKASAVADENLQALKATARKLLPGSLRRPFAELASGEASPHGVIGGFQRA